MSGYTRIERDLFDASGAWAGRVDLNGREQLGAAGSGASTPPPVTLTAATTIVAANHGNRTIYADSTVAIQLTIGTGGWVDGDFVYVVAKNAATAAITVGDLLGHITPNYAPQLTTAGASIKLRYDAIADRWQAMEQPVFQANNAGKSTMVVASNGAIINWGLNGYTDVNFTTGSLWFQCGNSGYNGAPTDLKIFPQSTVFYTRTAPQIAAGYGNYSHCRIGAETTYYDNATRIAAYLWTTPFYNIETVFPGATETGERNRLVLTGGQGLIIGSDAGNTYNGKWAQFDTNGNAFFYRSWGNASRQKDIGAGGNITIGVGVTNLILAGSGTASVFLPAAPSDGQIASVQVRTAYTAIGVNGNGSTLIASAAVGVTAGSFASWRYDATDATWDRMA